MKRGVRLTGAATLPGLDKWTARATANLAIDCTKSERLSAAIAWMPGKH